MLPKKRVPKVKPHPPPKQPNPQKTPQPNPSPAEEGEWREPHNTLKNLSPFAPSAVLSLSFHRDSRVQLAWAGRGGGVAELEGVEDLEGDAFA